jgi:REP element-mobilizing transposase RayT
VGYDHPMSYTNLLYHIVYGTKDRLPLITRELRPDLHRYLGGLVNGLNGTPLEINGVADHVHVLGLCCKSRTCQYPER